MRLEQIYQDVILDHYKHPHHRGLREPFGAEVHHVNPTCGDEVTLRVALSDDGEQVTDVSYDGQGCSISQAATSVLADLVIGQTLGDALKTVEAFAEMVSSRGTNPGNEETLGDGIAFAGVSKYPARVKCALLGWLAFKAAVAEATAFDPAVAEATAFDPAVAEATAFDPAVAEATASKRVSPLHLHHAEEKR